MNVHENSMHTLLPEFFEDSDNPFFECNLAVSSPENIFSILEALDGVSTSELNSLPQLDNGSNLCQQEGDSQQPQTAGTNFVSEGSTFSFNANPLEVPFDTELEAVDLHKTKKQKLAATRDEAADGQQKVSHITVERNRRRQMNENLSILRSLMPSFYVKRGDQASVVGGVVDYITELQQVLQSLEAKKQRKVYSEVLSPRLISSPRKLPISPRKPPLSPRLMPSLPVSPRTPTSPYKHHGLLQLVPYNFSQTIMSPSNSSPSSPVDRHNAVAAANDLAANSKSGIADVEVKFSGPHVILKTVSAKIPGQALKIILALEDFSLQILHVRLSTTDEAMIISFTIKIGIECQLSAEDLALHVQQTFC
ncbi:Transcription factor SPEECHLESS [Heracleum sosnowskyi]|uniref:Transcription factor SPEECHLESS n=1 Tax=Heracleum sosnowskyi TaxID=360622 RepID=A0AAD8IUQ1_9APIA|nr:Transcription factor SPEECHLESS [Heracleum sosnowskyi]